MTLTTILLALKSLAPALEPIAQAQFDNFVKSIEANLAAPGGSPDIKMLESDMLGAVQLFIDHEGQKLIGKV